MATKNPRINVTLSTRCYAMVKSISESSGKPMSGFISEMLESALPTLERMAVTFQKIKAAQDSERSKFLETIDDAQDVLEPAVMHALGQFDLFMGKIDSVVESHGAFGADEAQGLEAAAPIPRTNRGVTNRETKQPQPKHSKALKPVLKSEVSIRKTGSKILVKKHKKGVAV